MDTHASAATQVQLFPLRAASHRSLPSALKHRPSCAVYALRGPNFSTETLQLGALDTLGVSSTPLLPWLLSPAKQLGAPGKAGGGREGTGSVVLSRRDRCHRGAPLHPPPSSSSIPSAAGPADLLSLEELRVPAGLSAQIRTEILREYPLNPEQQEVSTAGLREAKERGNKDLDGRVGLPGTKHPRLFHVCLSSHRCLPAGCLCPFVRCWSNAWAGSLSPLHPQPPFSPQSTRRPRSPPGPTLLQPPRPSHWSTAPSAAARAIWW